MCFILTLPIVWVIVKIWKKTSWPLNTAHQGYHLSSTKHCWPPLWRTISSRHPTHLSGSHPGCLGISQFPLLAPLPLPANSLHVGVSQEPDYNPFSSLCITPSRWHDSSYHLQSNNFQSSELQTAIFYFLTNISTINTNLTQPKPNPLKMCVEFLTFYHHSRWHFKKAITFFLLW